MENGKIVVDITITEIHHESHEMLKRRHSFDDLKEAYNFWKKHNEIEIKSGGLVSVGIQAVLTSQPPQDE